MQYRVVVPSAADASSEMVVLEKRVAVGELVAADAPLVALETDKVDWEVPSPVTGILLEWLVADGEEVSEGSPLAVIETDSDV